MHKSVYNFIKVSCLIEYIYVYMYIHTLYEMIKNGEC